MKSSRKTGMMNVAASGVREIQESMDAMAIPTGKTQGGRVVQCKAAITQSPGKMAAASCAFQRTTRDTAVAVTSTSGTAWNTVNAEKTRTVEKPGVWSQRADGLDHAGRIDEQLGANNEPWKKAHDPVVHGKDTASSESIPSTSMQGSSNFQAIPGPVVLKQGMVTASVTTRHVVPDDDTSLPSESKEKPSQETGLTVTGALSATINVNFPESRAAPGKDKAQTGRARSGDNAAAIQEFHQMAAAVSNTFQQMAINDGIAVQGSPDTNEETVSAGEARSLKTEGCVYKPSSGVRRDVVASLRSLQNKQQIPGIDPLQFCLAVIKHIEQVKKTHNINDPQSQNYKFLVFQFGPSYVSSLRPALEILKDKAANQCIWEYHQEIIGIAKYFFLYPNTLPDKSDNKKLLTAIYKMAVICEIHYMESVRKFSLEKLVTGSCYILSQLLDWEINKLECSDIEPLGMNETKFWRRQMEELNKGVRGRDEDRADRLGCNDDAIDECIEKTEEALCNKTADALVVRLYNELLKIQLADLNVRRKSMKDMRGNKAIHEAFPLLKQSYRIHDKCTTLIPKNHLVRDGVVATISGFARMILEASLDNAIQLEKETMELIGDLMNKDLLGDKCITSYLFCKELHVLIGTAIQVREMTDCQYRAELDEIDSLMADNTGNSFLIAAGKLGQLLFSRRKKPQAQHVKYTPRYKYRRITTLKNGLYDALFKPVMERIYSYRKASKSSSDYGRYDAFLSKLRPEIVELNSFSFVFTDMKCRLKWAHLACPAWHSDLERMARKKSLTEEDVDRLLELKHVVPDVANMHTRKCLKAVFANCLTLTLDDYAGIPVEKIMTLTEWCTELDCLYKPLPQHELRLCSPVMSGATGKGNNTGMKMACSP